MKIWKSMTFWYLLVLLAMPLLLLAEPATQPADQAKPADQTEPKDPADVMQPVDPQNAIIQLPDGRTLNLADLQAQGGGNFVFVRAVGTGGAGDRSIEVNEDDRKITINETDEGIVVTIKEGNAEPVEYRAKDAEELEEKHPEAFEVYEKYAQDFQGQLPGPGAMAAGGRMRIALAGPGGGPGFAFAHGQPHGFEIEALGASCLPIWDEFIKVHLGEGVRVVDVQDDTPASELGLQKLDMIRTINGKKVANNEDIEKIIEDAGGADKLTMEVVRAGQTIKLEPK